MNTNIYMHPCFGDDCHTYARIHLPVAPACNIQCNYCLRRYDCVNESRPGVTTAVLTADDAAELCERACERMPNLTIAGIAGPGDALANFPAVYEVLAKIREKQLPVEFCLSTNGLRLPEYLPQLLELGVKYLTVTVNAVDVKVGSKIYDHVIWNGEMLRGEDAFTVLSKNQLVGLEEAVKQGMICKVNTIILPGVNDEHIPEVAQKAGELGCYMQNLIPVISVAGTKFYGLPKFRPAALRLLREECGRYIRQMQHCQRCRADAVGTLSQSCTTDDFLKSLKSCRC